MAKELMEIGGFITEGAEIVNHDNSLSGNGTVDSPLGVVPGYNETVLFEDTNGHGMDNSITLSDDVDKFDRIRIYYNVWSGAATRVMEFTFTNQCVMSNLEQFTTTGLNIIVWQFNPLTSSNKRTVSLNYFNYFEGKWTGTALTKSNFLVFKIVGINRKAQ